MNLLFSLLAKLLKKTACAVDAEPPKKSKTKSAIYFLSKYKEDSVKVANAGIVLLPEKYRGGSPPIRELSLYETVMERSRNDG